MEDIKFEITNGILFINTKLPRRFNINHIVRYKIDEYSSGYRVSIHTIQSSWETESGTLEEANKILQKLDDAFINYKQPIQKISEGEKIII